MRDAARKEAVEAGWPDDTIHLEYVMNTAELVLYDNCEVAIARYGKTHSEEYSDARHVPDGAR